MRQNEIFTKRLKDMLSRLDDMEDNYSSNEDKTLQDLDDMKDELEEVNEHLFHFEDHLYTGDKDPNYFVKKAEECNAARKLVNRVQKRMENLRREITGYDERAIMEMMYPNEDIDSEDFEDGFDPEDFYEDNTYFPTLTAMQQFVHLHIHSQYSIMDGLADVKELVDKAIADGMPGMAITDHGNMMGIKEFCDYVSRINKRRADEDLAPFKPIIGCEVYVADDDTEKRFHLNGGNHLTLLAKNLMGYRNLLWLVSKSWTEGFFIHPRITKQQLKEHSDGLIACSGCMGGEVPRLILADNLVEAERIALWHKEVFGEDYYFELQRHKATTLNVNQEVYPIQQKVNMALLELAHKHNIKVVATNNVHFVNAEDAETHDRLICIATGQCVNDKQRMLYTKQEWLKSTAEMNELFADVPQALANTVEILDKVELYSIDHKPALPVFPFPEGFASEDDYLRHLAYEGAHRRWGDNLTTEQQTRLNFELETIKNIEASNYFLIIQDLISAAISRGAIVGPGRGSAAGSAVCYCLGITQVDPFKFNLLFERFINPERPIYPDIDIDFDNEGREIVISYLKEKYGKDNVANIVTLNNMSVQRVIKDVAKVEGLSIAQAYKLSTDVVSYLRGKNDWYYCRLSLKDVKKVKDIIDNPDSIIKNTFRYAKQLEGVLCGTGIHACGIVLSPDAVQNWAPLRVVSDGETGEPIVVTQYDGRNVEDTGLVKFDFLGLKTLSIIKETLRNIYLNHGIEIDINNIPLDDAKTLDLYKDGRTVGTFQFDTPGMRKYLLELQPQKFEDLTALNALYRPGTLEFIPEFIERKRGLTPITYDIPGMEKYLKDTYGVLVYQEQIMQLSQMIANFTPGESDTLRKALGKRHMEKLSILKTKFLAEGQANGYESSTLEKNWTEWERFASYAFNKSHATCYTLIGYQTAWLKANYPKEYMSALLNNFHDDEEKYSRYTEEFEEMGL